MDAMRAVAVGLLSLLFGSLGTACLESRAIERCYPDAAAGDAGVCPAWTQAGGKCPSDPVAACGRAKPGGGYCNFSLVCPDGSKCVGGSSCISNGPGKGYSCACDPGRYAADCAGKACATCSFPNYICDACPSDKKAACAIGECNLVITCSDQKTFCPADSVCTAGAGGAYSCNCKPGFTARFCDGRACPCPPGSGWYCAEQ